MGFEFKTPKPKFQPKPETIKLNSLLGSTAKDPEYFFGKSFKVVGVRISELDPGSYKQEYTVQLTSGERKGEYQFCVSAVFKDSKGQTLQIKQMWEPFAKVIGISARDFVELEEDEKMKAFANIDSDARYDIVVKFTNDGFKLSNLKLAGEDDAEGDAVFPPAKKAKKTAAEET